MPTRKIRRRMNNRRRPLSRTGKPMGRKSKEAPGIGASTTWREAITRK
jgi:hypothetical protein